MNELLIPESLMYAVYFAPRGKNRLLNLGHEIAQRHLSPLDKLIGVIGDAGAGKSVLIKGMFPGLELSNDDRGVNSRPPHLLRNSGNDFFTSHTYHIDIHFEGAFYQMYELAEAVKRAIDNGKRVVIEHFDLIYPFLGINAEMLIGIGEEVIVTRPNLFGPLPQDICDIVFKSIKYRKMAHTAEDLTCKVLEEYYGLGHSQMHGDVKHGFVIEFRDKPDIDIAELEVMVKEMINQAYDISYLDETHIKIGETENFHCTGPRIHVRNTSDIENFQLVKEFKYSEISRLYALIGLVGQEKPYNINDLNKLNLL
jgi:tRNA A37 threonylcarbamoyladenosine biosynthesis protein TsaE